MLNVQEKAGNYDKANPPPPQNQHFTRKKVSVVFSYRNREYMRVKRCLDSLANQSFSDFEAVFVDYGSSASFRNEVRPLVESYPFARYHYAWTEDYAWNRSHALNIGIRLSDSEYILLADIDLIYSPDALRGLVAEAGKDTAVYSSMFYLERSFAGWEDLPRPEASVLRDSGDDPIGAVYLVHKDILEHIRGFDEYYAFWGVEDRDLHHRIQMLGISSTRIDKTRYPIYHQWHPIVSDRTRDFFPEKWWDDMNIHYALNENVIRRNGAGWGQLVGKSDRPVLDAKDVVFEIPFRYGRSYDKPVLYSRILKSLSRLNAGECLRIELRQTNMPNMGWRLIRYFNLFFRLVGFPFGIDRMMNVEREKYFYPSPDLMYLVWHLIRKDGVIRDYYIRDEGKKTVIKLMMK